MIVDPFGKVLAGPLHDEDGLLIADLDLNEHAGPLRLRRGWSLQPARHLRAHG